ncbi:MAG TPA: OmpA family protein [Balneolales bacterium]|nr:OmpA family protein [Balneolales bacterium]
MKRQINYFLQVSMLLAGLSTVMACSSSKQVATKNISQPVTQPKKTVPPPPPVNPFKNDTTKTNKKVVRKKITLKTVHFAFDKSNLNDHAAQLLAGNVEILRKDPQIHVKIDAYTDHIGSDQYNIRLSERRARTVMNFYESNGIPANRIIARGLGKAPVPCWMNTPEKGCRKNRRAESRVFYSVKNGYS